MRAPLTALRNQDKRTIYWIQKLFADKCCPCGTWKRADRLALVIHAGHKALKIEDVAEGRRTM